MSRTAFRTELDELRSDLAGMSRLVSQIMINASAALLKADPVLAELVIARADELDAQHHDVEQRCAALLARHPQDAVELPTVVALCHTAGDLQRMGTVAQHTARMVRLAGLSLTTSVDVRTVIAQMSLLASGLAYQAAVAIERLDPLSGDRLARADGEVAALARQLSRIVFAENWLYGRGSAVYAALIGRYVETFADHAVAIARQVCHLADDPLGTRQWH